MTIKLNGKLPSKDEANGLHFADEQEFIDNVKPFLAIVALRPHQLTQILDDDGTDKVELKVTHIEPMRGDHGVRAQRLLAKAHSERTGGLPLDWSGNGA